MNLILINVRATFFRIFEWLIVVFKYYRRLAFLWVDLVLFFHYLFKSPHRISKAFMKKRGEKNLYVYGETPLTTLDKICFECGILSKDLVFELGCGPGRGVFWIQKFVGCKVYGVDHLPEFIRKAKSVQKWTNSSGIVFMEKDFLELDYTRFSVLYLYGTCLEEDFIVKLADRFLSLPAKAKVITVSYPITDYAKPNAFKIEKSFMAHFPWGKAEVFLNLRQ